MKKELLVFIIAAAFLQLIGCSVAKLQKKGSVASDSFHYTCGFSTVKTVIILPVEINGITKNFLFDTGAEVTLIQRDSIRGKTATVTGATRETMKLGKETIPSLKIGDIEFVDTYAMSGDFIGLKEQIPDFGGIIGQPIISKANWLIDYPNKRMEISNKHQIDSTFRDLKIQRKGGLPYVILTIDGSEYRALIDLGSSSAFSIPSESNLAKQILQKYDFRENEREIYTIGGLENTKEKTGTIATLSVNGITFENVEATIRRTSQLRIGNDFFKDYIVSIDNENSRYSIKKVH
ncbi:MAG: hypothetical protein EA361_01765 [Bacteroidetes bacterium]|nr:MAG: hypothetical protein EA361_01765 [Bacteroidota bacterium]